MLFFPPCFSILPANKQKYTQIIPHRHALIEIIKKGSTPSNYNSFSSFQDVNACRDLHEGILNKEQEDEMFVYGYRKSTFRSFICYLCIGLSLGLLRLVMHWWSHWLLLATHKKCSLRLAEKVLVKEEFQGKHAIYYVKSVITLTSDSIRYVKLNNLLC